MDWETMLRLWDADLYDQEETQTEDVELLRRWIGTIPQCILEIACGSGRILLPLVRDGHRVTGIDRDPYMVARLFAKAGDASGFTVTLDDAVTCDWGDGYDVVVLGGNILLNIASTCDQRETQRLFLRKAFAALRPGGHLFLDGDTFSLTRPTFAHPGERVIFEGTDSRGVRGRYVLIDTVDDIATQTITGRRRWELTLPDGQSWSKEESYRKQALTVQDIDGWLAEEGFLVEQRWGGYDGRPYEQGHGRATYWVKRP